jgi:hypothetical protein
MLERLFENRRRRAQAVATGNALALVELVCNGRLRQDSIIVDGQEVNPHYLDYEHEPGIHDLPSTVLGVKHQQVNPRLESFVNVIAPWFMLNPTDKPGYGLAIMNERLLRTADVYPGLHFGVDARILGQEYDESTAKTEYRIADTSKLAEINAAAIYGNHCQHPRVEALYHEAVAAGTGIAHAIAARRAYAEGHLL